MKHMKAFEDFVKTSITYGEYIAEQINQNWLSGYAQQHSIIGGGKNKIESSNNIIRGGKDNIVTKEDLKEIENVPEFKHVSVEPFGLSDEIKLSHI